MNPLINETHKSLLDNSLFNPKNENKAYLYVTKNQEGNHSLAITHPNFFERLLAKLEWVLQPERSQCIFKFDRRQTQLNTLLKFVI